MRLDHFRPFPYLIISATILTESSLTMRQIGSTAATLLRVKQYLKSHHSLMSFPGVSVMSFKTGNANSSIVSKSRHGFNLQWR
jgi:hypothetical protein